MALAEVKPIELALQGGGAHGAFTWGVLDRLLEDRRLQIEGISGTSAGAMNAAIVAHGIFDGGCDAARAGLEDFWSAVSAATRLSPMHRSPLEILFGRWSLDWSPGFLTLEAISRLFTPYDLNPLDINPLREILARHIDFECVNHCTDLRLFITATNVRTGLPKVFRQPEITLDSLMASACLPTLFKAVEIDGESYWDGGFMGNPTLFPLVDECSGRDIVLVQINPIYRDKVPTTAPEIADRINEITFNASLIKELRSIGFLWELIHGEALAREGYRDVRLHRIHADEAMQQLSASSKLIGEWEFLTHLRDVGRATADQWLEENFDQLGHKSTFDIGFVYPESLRPAYLS